MSGTEKKDEQKRSRMYRYLFDEFESKSMRVYAGAGASKNINVYSGSMDRMKIAHVNHLLDWFREFACDLYAWPGSLFAHSNTFTLCTHNWRKNKTEPIERKKIIEKDEIKKASKTKQNQTKILRACSAIFCSLWPISFYPQFRSLVCCVCVYVFFF